MVQSNRKLENVLLLSHDVEISAHGNMTSAVIGEIPRFMEQKPLRQEISHPKLLIMTPEK